MSNIKSLGHQSVHSTQSTSADSYLNNDSPTKPKGGGGASGNDGPKDITKKGPKDFVRNKSGKEMPPVGTGGQ